MQYMGGKTRIAQQLAEKMLATSFDYNAYVEPFVGGASVAALMAPMFQLVYLNDASPDLIEMWSALQQGWQPPTEVSEDEYNALRYAPVSPLRGFVGYSCSFGGKWFGGYARDPRKRCSFAQTAINGINRKLPYIRHAQFSNHDYRDLIIPKGSLVYCDPPYRSATKYDRLADFDSDEFWKHAREWSGTSSVFVSEYTAPEGWQSVWSATPYMTLKRGDNNTRATEHLWHYVGNLCTYSQSSELV